MAKHIRDAAASRCDWVMTETDEDAPMRPNSSFHNMTRTGFLLAQQRRNNVFKTRQVVENTSHTVLFIPENTVCDNQNATLALQPVTFATPTSKPLCASRT